MSETIITILTILSSIIGILALLRDVFDYKIHPNKISDILKNRSFIAITFSITLLLIIYSLLSDEVNLSSLKNKELIYILIIMSLLSLSYALIKSFFRENVSEPEPEPEPEPIPAPKKHVIPPYVRSKKSNNSKFMSDDYLANMAANLTKKSKANDEINIQDKTQNNL